MHSLTRYLRALPWLGQALGLLSAILLPLGQAAADVAPFKNVVLILSDDHRYDFLGFHPDGPEFIETPNFDRMAREGAHMENAFVTTSLCSPSRATILTGQYMHRHKVVDNQRAVPKGTRFFPEYLQSSGIETAYIGKWSATHPSPPDPSRLRHTHGSCGGWAQASRPVSAASIPRRLCAVLPRSPASLRSGVRTARCGSTYPPPAASTTASPSTTARPTTMTTASLVWSGFGR